MLNWVSLALICAVLAGTVDALTKKLMSKSNERLVGWANLLFSLPWLFAALQISGWPSLSVSFWVLMAFLIPLDLAAFLCYLRAIRLGPLSLTVPFLAVTPLATSLTGWLFLGERVTGLGFLGIVSVTVGAYLLQMELAADGLLEPLKAVVQTPAIRSMLSAALIYSVGATLSKRAIQLSSPVAFPFLLEFIEVVLLSGLAYSATRGSGGPFRAIRLQLPLFALAGFLTMGAILAHSFGIQWAPVAYFISVKRLSLFVSVLYGGFFFREANFRERIIGASFMLSGAILIALRT